MHLKSLTLKGFKSFASPTTLRFEPGVTAVVGPNGSGKSNVVDAITWVLGEQGAKALRGGKMEDVIFAGTTGRPPLGRAEVTLTIDNADNGLPIDYTEVSITRRMFRDGASEYEINGDTARLLDVQELLSDTGIGREMHVIVGQGQLDSVLQARPEDRRGFIEEAAGVLKHRRRKERAGRKLDAMQPNLTRLADLSHELGRQLKPLGRQADLARRAAGIQAELRDSRLRLLAADVNDAVARLDAELADEAAIRDRQAVVQATLADAIARDQQLEAELAADTPAVSAAVETYFRLSGVRDRLQATDLLAGERLRHLTTVAAFRPGQDPDVLEAQAAAAQAAEAALGADLAVAGDHLDRAVGQREQAEAALAEAEAALLHATRAVADRREGLAKLAGQVDVLRTRAAAGADEIARMSQAIDQVRQRAERAGQDLALAGAEADAIDRGEQDLDSAHEQCRGAYEALVEQHTQAIEHQRAADGLLATWTARRDALEVGVTHQDAAALLLSPEGASAGAQGPLAGFLTVPAGWEAALTAALGAAAEAVVVESVAAAVAALGRLRREQAGRAGLLIAADQSTAVITAPERDGWPALPPGVHWVIDQVGIADQVAPALAPLLHQVAVTDALVDAQSLVQAHPAVRVVTLDGDLVGAHWAAGGSALVDTALQLRAAAQEARRQIAVAEAEHDKAAAQAVTLAAQVQAARVALEVSLQALNASDARLTAVQEALGQRGLDLRAAQAESDRLQAGRLAAAAARDRDLAGLSEQEERLRLAQAEPTDGQPSPTRRDERAAAVAAARQAELDARLTVRSAEEKLRAVSGRSQDLHRAAQAERQARLGEELAVAQRARDHQVASQVQRAARRAVEELAALIGRAGAERDALQEAGRTASEQLRAVRTRAGELSAELAGLTDAVHRDEVARTEQRLRIEQLHQRSAAEFGIPAEVLLAEYGPDQPVPPSAAQLTEFTLAGKPGKPGEAGKPGKPGEATTAPAASVFDRATQVQREARAQRELSQLGRINPLALEEFAALEERNQFLATQLEDLKKTRRDLLGVIKDVDDRILAVFTDAFRDVAAEFEIVFASLFPGGQGRLVLTEPDDMLHTGIEIEARPPGKKVKRLSLLSGGERSLTAVALLVAIFRARPSPFYVLDEIEAALDDVNLGRLLGLIGQLRESSQILIITHQKRTMEIADALYGVTMRGDGISQVISQRLTQP